MPVLGPMIVARNVDGIDGIMPGYGGVGCHGRWGCLLRLSIGCRGCPRLADQESLRLKG